MTAELSEELFLPDPQPRPVRYTVISVDDHVVEPAHMFEGRVPAALADRAPRIIETSRGYQIWEFEGRKFSQVGMNAVAGRRPETVSIEPFRFDQMRPGCYDVDARVRDMDLNGVWASMNFPSQISGFCGRVFFDVADRDLGLACLRAWNDWLFEEWYSAHPTRIIPLGITYLADPQLAAAEIRRNVSGDAADLIRSYRAGYLAAERREIEAELFSGALRGVVATNALELGVDIGGLDAVVLCDRVTGEYLEVSDSFCRLTGYGRADLLGHSSVELGLVEPGGVRMVAEADAVLGHEGMYENTVTRRDGSRVIIEFTHSFLQEGYTLVVARDVTARKEREAALHRLSRVDELTDVLNRRGFRADLDAALDAALAEGADLHLLVADADHLKRVNDELGHEYGDQLLITAAAVLRAATAPHGVVGRLGGDEFAAFLPGASPEEATAMAARTRTLLGQRRIGPHGDDRPASASVGIASTGEAGYDAVALLALADTRMYDAKATRA